MSSQERRTAEKVPFTNPSAHLQKVSKYILTRLALEADGRFVLLHGRAFTIQGEGGQLGCRGQIQLLLQQTHTYTHRASCEAPTLTTRWTGKCFKTRQGEAAVTNSRPYRKKGTP